MLQLLLCSWGICLPVDGCKIRLLLDFLPAEAIATGLSGYVSPIRKSSTSEESQSSPVTSPLPPNMGWSSSGDLRIPAASCCHAILSSSIASASRTGLSVASLEMSVGVGCFSTYCRTSMLTYLRRSSEKCDVPAMSGPICRPLNGFAGACACGVAWGALAARRTSAGRFPCVMSRLHCISTVLRGAACRTAAGCNAA